MLLFDIFNIEGKIIESGVDKETAAKVLGVEPQNLYKETSVKGRKKRFKIGEKFYIVYTDGQTVLDSARPDSIPTKTMREFDQIRMKILSCTGATERR